MNTNSPFASLPQKMSEAKANTLKLPALPTKAEPKTRKKREILKAKPVYLRKLVEKTSKAEAARLCGMNYATIYDALKQDQASAVLETAAFGVYKDMFEKPAAAAEARPTVTLPNGDVFVSMSISQAAFDQVRPWLKDAGAKVRIFRD